jgi:hypothetical protein
MTVDAYDLPSGTLVVFDGTIDIDAKIGLGTWSVILGRATHPNGSGWSYIILCERRVTWLSPQALLRRFASGAAQLLA